MTPGVVQVLDREIARLIELDRKGLLAYDAAVFLKGLTDQRNSAAAKLPEEHRAALGVVNRFGETDHEIPTFAAGHAP